MFQKLSFEKYNLILPFLTNAHLSLNLLPVIYQTFLGEIWVDDLKKPTCSYVFDTRHGHFLVGDITNNVSQLVDFLNDLFAKRFKGTNKYFSLLFSNEWAKLFSNGLVLQEKDVTLHSRQLFKLDKPQIHTWNSLVPEGYTILAIEKSLLQKDLTYLQYLKEELIDMWGDIDNFFNIGFGSCAIFQNTLAGYCLGEYFISTATDKKFGIGIETFPKFQKQGIATAMTALLIEMGMAKGYDIYWDCFKDNIASARTALKTGFVLEMEYEVFTGHF